MLNGGKRPHDVRQCLLPILAKLRTGPHPSLHRPHHSLALPAPHNRRGPRGRRHVPRRPLPRAQGHGLRRLPRPGLRRLPPPGAALGQRPQHVGRVLGGERGQERHGHRPELGQRVRGHAGAAGGPQQARGRALAQLAAPHADPDGAADAILQLGGTLLVQLHQPPRQVGQLARHETRIPPGGVHGFQQGVTEPHPAVDGPHGYPGVGHDAGGHVAALHRGQQPLDHPEHRVHLVTRERLNAVGAQLV
mmetsp:Transcript_15843/g.35246  ORF Transcript_15843/g.35246 Transcript_15843/m.35246 type:complete len:248 (-) Transcript_15843:205-948(-)